MALTERAQWLTDFFKEKAQDWIELSTEDLIEEYRHAFPEESPTPGYIGSQLEALEQMGLITIDRPEFGQRRPTRYVWSGHGGNGSESDSTEESYTADDQVGETGEVSELRVEPSDVEIPGNITRDPSEVEMPKITSKPVTRGATVGSSMAEKKLEEMESFIALIKSRIGDFENAAEDLRRFIQEQGEVIERQVILDDPNLDYRLESIKVKKKS